MLQEQGWTRGRASLGKTEIPAQHTSISHVIEVTIPLPPMPIRGKGELSLIEDNICNFYDIFVTNVWHML